MSNFKPRLKIPEYGNPYYNRKPTGYNPCILGNNDKGQRVKGLNVLPNCVGYAVGRFNEVGGKGNCNYLGSKNPCDMISLARKQGLKITKEPVIGGAMVWSGGVGGLGHICNVEAIIADTVIKSESEWYKLPFVVYSRKKGIDGNYRQGCYWMSARYRYEGCINNPYVKEEEELLPYDEFKKYMDQYLKELADKEDTWATIPIAEVEKLGIMIGDPSGNFRPNSWVTRAELAQTAINIINFLEK